MVDAIGANDELPTPYDLHALEMPPLDAPLVIPPPPDLASEPSVPISPLRAGTTDGESIFPFAQHQLDSKQLSEQIAAAAPPPSFRTVHVRVGSCATNPRHTHSLTHHSLQVPVTSQSLEIYHPKPEEYGQDDAAFTKGLRLLKACLQAMAESEESMMAWYLEHFGLVFFFASISFCVLSIWEIAVLANY